MSVRTADVVADLVSQIGTTSLPVVNTGDRVEIHHPDLPHPATGLVRGCVFGSQEAMVRLDGTDQLVNVPIRLLRRSD